MIEWEGSGGWSGAGGSEWGQRGKQSFSGREQGAQTQNEVKLIFIQYFACTSRGGQGSVQGEFDASARRPWSRQSSEIILKIQKKPASGINNVIGFGSSRVSERFSFLFEAFALLRLPHRPSFNNKDRPASPLVHPHPVVISKDEHQLLLPDPPEEGDDQGEGEGEGDAQARGEEEGEAQERQTRQAAPLGPSRRADPFL